MLNYIRYLSIAPIAISITIFLFISFFTLAILDVIGVFMLGQLISIVIQGNESDSIIISLFNSFDITLPRDIIIYLSIAISSYFILKSLAAYFIQIKLLDVSYGIMVKMRIALMNKYLNADYLDVVVVGFSTIATKINIHCDTYVRGIYIPLMRLICDFMMLFLLGLFLFGQNPIVFPLFVICILSSVCFYMLLIKSKLFKAGKNAALASEIFLSDIKNSIRGIKESKILGKQEYYLAKFSKNVEHLAENIKLHDKYVILPKYFIEAILVTVMLLLVIVALWFYGYQNNEAYVMIGYYLASSLRIMPSMNQTIISIGNMRNATYIVEELQKEFNQIDSIVKKEPKLLNYDKSIRFDNVSFSYPGSSEKVLKNINILINKGDKVGIIGESGSGKTTFIDILTGLIQPKEGALLIDDEKLMDENKYDWMQKISFISQNISLFNASIKENIILDLDNIDEEKLQDSVEKSGLSRELPKFINNIDNLIGDEGSFMSGGQKQRIGIARAIYHSRDIMVLDEATTGLDADLEKEILGSVYSICKDKTLFIISHNHKILSECNVILKIENGTISQAELG